MFLLYPWLKYVIFSHFLYRYIHYNSLYSYRNSYFETCMYSWLKELAEKHVMFAPLDKCLINVLLSYFNFDIERFEKVCKYYMDNALRFEPSEVAFFSFVLRGIERRLRKSKESSLFFPFYVSTSPFSFSLCTSTWSNRCIYVFLQLKFFSAFNNAAMEHLKNEKYEKIDWIIKLFRIYSYSTETLKNTDVFKLIIER